MLKVRNLTESLEKKYNDLVDESYEYEMEDELDYIMDDNSLSDIEREQAISNLYSKYNLHESNSCDGWIAFYNGKKLEIPKSDVDGGIYEAKQKAIKELKVPKSKIGLLSIKPAYNESFVQKCNDTARDMGESLKESFFEPTEWFDDFIDNYETYTPEEWNNWGQKRRDAEVMKSMKLFLMDNPLSEDEAKEFMDDLEDNNFHTAARALAKLCNL